MPKLFRGEYSEADGVLQAAVKENLPTDGQIKHAFLVGVARDGDADRLARQLHHHQPGDQVLLDAAVALSEKAPQHLDVVVSRMPCDRLQLSQACLRPIKELIENGQVMNIELGGLRSILYIHIRYLKYRRYLN